MADCERKSSLDTTPNDRNPSGTFLLIRDIEHFLKSASVLWLRDSEPHSVPFRRKHWHVHSTRCFRSGTALEDFVRDSRKCTFLMLGFLEVFWQSIILERVLYLYQKCDVLDLFGRRKVFQSSITPVMSEAVETYMWTCHSMRIPAWHGD